MDENAIVQTIIMIVYLGLIILFGYVIVLVIKALKKYLRED
jgi:hypothetical protein